MFRLQGLEGTIEGFLLGFRVEGKGYRTWMVSVHPGVSTEDLASGGFWGFWVKGRTKLRELKKIILIVRILSTNLAT